MNRAADAIRASAAERCWSAVRGRIGCKMCGGEASNFS